MSMQECPTPIDKVVVLEEMIFPQCEKLGQTIIFVRTREIARTLHAAVRSRLPPSCVHLLLAKWIPLSIAVAGCIPHSLVASRDMSGSPRLQKHGHRTYDGSWCQCAAAGEGWTQMHQHQGRPGPPAARPGSE